MVVVWITGHRQGRERQRRSPCLPGVAWPHEQDFSAEGFEWIDWQDADSSIFSWLRRAADGSFVVCVSNFTPLVRSGYRLGVPRSGYYKELINTDAKQYGGSGAGIRGNLNTANVAAHGRPQSLQIDLPPLATLILKIAKPVSGRDGE